MRCRRSRWMLRRFVQTSPGPRSRGTRFWVSSPRSPTPKTTASQRRKPLGDRYVSLVFSFPSFELSWSSLIWTDEQPRRSATTLETALLIESGSSDRGGGSNERRAIPDCGEGEYPSGGSYGKGREDYPEVGSCHAFTALHLSPPYPPRSSFGREPLQGRSQRLINHVYCLTVETDTRGNIGARPAAGHVSARASRGLRARLAGWKLEAPARQSRGIGASASSHRHIPARRRETLGRGAEFGRIRRPGDPLRSG